jgi:ABC-2 type transport system permease protein
MGLQEYRRTPVLLVLLVAAPVYVIGLFSVVVPTGQIPLYLASGTVTANLGGFVGALMAPVAGAFIGGLTGLFVMQMTQETDGRLVLAGYHPYQVGLSRLLLLGSVGVLVTIISVITLLLTGFTPASLGWFALATLLTTLVYAMVGVLAGAVLDTLSGVYLLLFVPMFDLFLFQNPMATDLPVFAYYLPGNFPMQLAMDAAFTENVDSSALGGSLVVCVVLTVLVTAAFYRSLRETG